MEGTTNTRKAAICELTKMREKAESLQAVNLQMEGDDRVDQWIREANWIQQELLKRSIDILEDWIIENQFDI